MELESAQQSFDDLASVISLAGRLSADAARAGSQIQDGVEMAVLLEVSYQ